MVAPLKKPATYQDLLDVPAGKVAQIIAGELHVHPRPAGPHAQAASVLGMDVGGAYHRGRGGPGGWWILDEPELHLGGDILVPDLAGWRRERMQAVPEAAYFELAPDWICEVLSPSTRILDRMRKLPIYAGQGVGHAWLVDPESKTLEVFRNHKGQWLLLGTYAEGAEVRAEPFEELLLTLGDLWTGG